MSYWEEEVLREGNQQLTKTNRLGNRLSVFRENNVSMFIFFVVIIVNIIAVCIATSVLIVLPENRGRGFLEMMKFAFTLMVNPSGKFPYGEQPISIVISSFVVLLGMISLTGGTVGYITSIMMNVLERSTQSVGKLKLKNHIVILNWNHKVASLVCDYAFDSVKDTYIVVLTEKDKKEVKAAIAQSLTQLQETQKIKFNHIIVRTGNPMSKAVLDSLSLYAAKTVMIMAPEIEGDYSKCESDQIENFGVSKLFMFISAYFKQETALRKRYELPPINMIAEIPNQNLERMIMTYETQEEKKVVTAVNYNEVLGKIFAMSTLMPALNGAMLHMFSFAGVELYIAPHNGLSIREDLMMQESALPLYDLDENYRIYLAEDEEAILSGEARHYELKKQLPEKLILPQALADKKEILIIGCNDKLPYILESMVCFKKEYPNSYVHVVLMDIPDNKELLNSYYEVGKYDEILKGAAHGYNAPVVVEDIFAPEESIDKKLKEEIDVVLFLSDENSDRKRIDEKPLMLWGNLRRTRKLADKDQMKHYIIELLDPQNETIIEKEQKDKVIISDHFLSCIYAQLGKDPSRLDIIKDFITFEDDSASTNHQLEKQNDCNLLCMKVEKFFEDQKMSLEFESKRELILWIYEATRENYMPLGFVRDGVDYLFPRYEAAGDGLEGSVLLDKTGQVKLKESKLCLLPEDELILLKFTKDEK